MFVEKPHSRTSSHAEYLAGQELQEVIFGPIFATLDLVLGATIWLRSPYIKHAPDHVSKPPGGGVPSYLRHTFTPPAISPRGIAFHSDPQSEKKKAE